MGASVLRNLAAAFNRLDSNELPNITVRASYRDESWETTSDEEGYFAFEIEPENPLASGETWHDLAVTWQHPEEDASGAAVTARVLTPPPTATFGVISDVDDTILRSYITSVVKMALEMLLKNAYSRVTFPGVPAFYRALHAGTGKGEQRPASSTGDNNPIFYVSLSPWNLYSLLSQFLEINDIPSGPLILRDYGLQTLTSLGGPSPKRKLIQDLLDMYPDAAVRPAGRFGPARSRNLRRDRARKPQPHPRHLHPRRQRRHRRRTGPRKSPPLPLPPRPAA